MSECFKVYFSAKGGFLKHKSGILHGYKMNSAGLELDKPGAWPAAGLSVSM